MMFYNREAAEYETDAPRAITNLLELLHIVPEEHEDIVLAAAKLAMNTISLPSMPRWTRHNRRRAIPDSYRSSKTTTLLASAAHR